MARFRRKRGRNFGLDEPLRHPDHKRPVSRRDFIAQGFAHGGAMVMGASMLSLFANPRVSHALSADLESRLAACNISLGVTDKIPFICFDLAGGANIAGSNVLVGRQGGQLDFLTTAGYSKLGLPGDRTPANSTTSFIDTSLGLAFHTESAFLTGINTRLSASAAAGVNGAVIPARSENDTGNNPHNPMYGIARAGADGRLATLIGSQSSESGGNSMAPAYLVNPSIRPTKVDRASDVTGLIDTGELVSLLGQADAVAVMESIKRLGDNKLARVSTRMPLGNVPSDADIKKLVECGYLKSAFVAENFGDPSQIDPTADPDIQAIFPDLASDGEFRKTAAVMKMVVNGLAGAGTITMGGFDYHTGERATGELRDRRAGACIGACLEYAARKNSPLMIYVFSDGSLDSNGMIDNSPNGGGKGVWTGDNQSTAASFFLVYSPNGRPTLFTGDNSPPERHQQLGWFRGDGSVETSSSVAANNVNLLVETVVLNYMALHGDQGSFGSIITPSGIPSQLWDSLIAFNPIV